MKQPTVAAFIALLVTLGFTIPTLQAQPDKTGAQVRDHRKKRLDRKGLPNSLVCENQPTASTRVHD